MKFLFNVLDLFLFWIIGITICSKSCKNGKYYCNQKKRPYKEQCFPKNWEYDYTCGYYKKDCPLGFCGKSADNACDACSDPTVIYYKKGECKPDEIVEQCDDFMRGLCHDGGGVVKPTSYKPVCGFKKDCLQGNCSKTFKNVCESCDTQNYIWYQDGPCKEDKGYCSNKKPIARASTTNPVCAFFHNGELQATVENAQTACLDSDVLFYLKGACPKPKNDMNFCLPNIRPKDCSKEEYKPVYGFNDFGTLDKMFPSACAACKNPKIIYYQHRADLYQCSNFFKTVGDPNDCSYNDPIHPICVKYEEQGTTRYVSMGNACSGCGSDETYTDGLCPGDEGIRCENDVLWSDWGAYPVCGVYKEGCTDNSCQQTYREGGIACADPNVILVRIGLCPGDEGIPCTLYRTDPFPDEERSIEPVCGYYRKGCTDNSCRVTFNDYYKACANSSIQFFTEGPCEAKCENYYYSSNWINPVCGVYQEGCTDNSCQQTYIEGSNACFDSNVILFRAGLCPGDEGIPCSFYRPENYRDTIGFSGLVCGFSQKDCNDCTCKETFNHYSEACSNYSIQFFKPGSC